jgi:hypothetical protein
LNASSSAASTQLVRITHPFHPFGGRQLVCVGERYNRSGKRLLLRADDGTVLRIPGEVARESGVISPAIPI